MAPRATGDTRASKGDNNKVKNARIDRPAETTAVGATGEVRRIAKSRIRRGPGRARGEKARQVVRRPPDRVVFHSGGDARGVYVRDFFNRSLERGVPKASRAIRRTGADRVRVAGVREVRLADLGED